VGWLVMDHRAAGESHASFFTRELLGEKQTMLASAHIGGIGGTFYAAVRQLDSGKVWAMVVLTTGCPGARFGWKAMEEQMGPCECDCPACILDLLTPTDDRYAMEWRQRCRNRAALFGAVVPGAKLEFSVDFLTPDGPHRAFEVVNPSKSLFRSPSGVAYRLTNWRTQTFAIVEGAS